MTHGPPANPRRKIAVVLVALAVGGLVRGALRLDLPLSVSLARAWKFWHADAREIRLDSDLFQGDRAFGQLVLQADQEWPLDKDLTLCLHPEFKAGGAEEKRREAAYVLAPRRVTVGRDCAEGALFRLIPSSVPPHHG